MSKNTESIDITNFLEQNYTINNTNICSDTLDQLTNKDYFRIKHKNWLSRYLAVFFSFAKK